MLKTYTYPQFPLNHRNSVSRLPDDLPDYMVYMTQEALRTVTGVWGGLYANTENYFFQMSQILAFDRSVRVASAWMTPPGATWFLPMPPGWTGYAPHPFGMIPGWHQYNPAFPLLSLSGIALPAPFSPFYGAPLPNTFPGFGMAVQPPIWRFGAALRYSN